MAFFSSKSLNLFLATAIFLGVAFPVKCQPTFGLSGDVETGFDYACECPNYFFMEVGLTNYGLVGITGGFVFPDEAPSPWDRVEYIDVRTNASTVNVFGATMNASVRLYGDSNFLIVAVGGTINNTIGLDGTFDSAVVGGTVEGAGLSDTNDPGCSFNGDLGITGTSNNFTLKHGATAESESVTLAGDAAVVALFDTNTVWNISPNGLLWLHGDNNRLIISNAQLNLPGNYGWVLDDGSSNIVIVAGQEASLNLGRYVSGYDQQLTVTSGAQMNVVGYGNMFEVGSGGGALISDPGTRLTVDETNGSGYVAVEISQNYQMVVSNGAQFTVSAGDVELAYTNTVLVTGSGSQFTITSNGVLYVGYNAPGSQFAIAAGGTASMQDVQIFSGSSVSVAGNLFVTNGGMGSITLNGGSLDISGRVVAGSISNPSGAIPFTSGTLATAKMNQSSGQVFVIGDGTNVANYQMEGGTHSFAGGLVVSSNSLLSGCGQISGPVTNYGTIILTNGCDMYFNGLVVNDGTILALNGNVHFGNGLINSGSVVQNTAQILGLSVNGNDVAIQFETVAGYPHDAEYSSDLSSGNWFTFTNGITGNGGPITVTNFGGATNQQRFYRVVWHY